LAERRLEAGLMIVVPLAPKLQLGSALVLEAPASRWRLRMSGRTLAKQSFEDKCVPKLELWNEGNEGKTKYRSRPPVYRHDKQATSNARPLAHRFTRFCDLCRCASAGLLHHASLSRKPNVDYWLVVELFVSVFPDGETVVSVFVSVFSFFSGAWLMIVVSFFSDFSAGGFTIVVFVSVFSAGGLFTFTSHAAHRAAAAKIIVSFFIAVLGIRARRGKRALIRPCLPRAKSNRNISTQPS
jgi:VIT1/CCC1 family predicted Fe2+/Mn2+ transporter